MGPTEIEEPSGSLYAPRPLFAVGDVHGMSHLLDVMIDEIATQIDSDGLSDAAVIFLGDYIDRGPDSRGTIDRLIEAPQKLGVETVFLKGNHEAFALRYIEKSYEESRWLQWGGDATVESYGVDPQDYENSVKGQIALSQAFAEAMGEAHLSFLRDTLVTHHNEWPFFFSHAGIDPAYPPDAQPEKALVHGIRSFLTQGGWPDSIAVHGHYITEEPDLGNRRIGVDTGAYRTGLLTTAYIHGETIDFIQVED